MQKTMSFAAVHFTVAFTITYILSGDILVGGIVALVEPMVNTVAFYAHEVLWNRFKRNKNATNNTLTA